MRQGLCAAHELQHAYEHAVRYAMSMSARLVADMASSSTGEAPHKCPYPNCDESFGDPARRHRHMKAVHNHIPLKRRTQSDQGIPLNIDMSEPEEEDAL